MNITDIKYLVKSDILCNFANYVISDIYEMNFCDKIDLYLRKAKIK